MAPAFTLSDAQGWISEGVRFIADGPERITD